MIRKGEYGFLEDHPKEKGIAFLVISAVSLMIFAGIMSILFVLEANRRNLEVVKERALAYYLCEIGASVAIKDIEGGCIGSSAQQTESGCRRQSLPKWTTETFNYAVGDKNYQINYSVTKVEGKWQILSWVGPSADFHYKYQLRVGGRRPFPKLFIQGFAGLGGL